MTTHTLPPISYNPDEDWLRPILGALLVHLLVVLIFGLAWLWSPTRNTNAAAGEEGTLEVSLELSGGEIAAAQRALSQSIAQSANSPLQPASPSRQLLPQPTVEPTRLPETVVPVIIPDTREQMRALAEQQRQQEEAERQRQAESLAEQQRQQEEAERQRQAESLAEQQRQQEEAERQRQAESLAEQQRQQEAAAQQQQEQEQQEAERQQRLAQAAELRQRREQLEQQAAQEQQRLERMRSEQRRADQAAAAASNAAASSSSANNNSGGPGNGGAAGAGGESNELLSRYSAAIQQAVLSQWIRPESIPLGQKCRLTINQIPAGGVSSVQFDPSCPYDEAGRRSVEAAILRASPLPYRGFESVFQRTLHFNFRAEDR